jgi:diguanylate cyclase (GGDEF)-like protein/PAS domain S-box-containing protein
MGLPIKLLVVEDSEDDAELLIAEIIRGGIKPQWQRVDTLADMRRALDEGEWDVIVSDYHIRTITAAQALDTLHQSGKDIPFIIVSGIVRADQVVSLLKNGAHDFLNKDSLARLVPAIERELREAEQRVQRRLAEERVRLFSLAIEQSPVSVVITDRDGVITYVNPRFCETAGYEAVAAAGRRLDFTCIAAGDDDPVLRSLWDTMREGREWRGELCNQRGDGQIFWEIATVSPLTDSNGEITHFVAVKEDITVRRSYEERLLRQAHYDTLTGLPNRMLMHERLEQAVAAARRGGSMVAMLYIDLDRFKTVNDALGHMIGDRMLQEAAARLGGCVRDSDTLSRLGGDEFVVILPGVSDRQDVRKVAERIVDAFAAPFQLEGQSHYVTASIGITLFPADTDEPQILVHNADLAMYKAKERGRNGFHFFTAEIDQETQERLVLEAGLRGAVGRREFSVFYQPIIDLRRSRPAGYEALLRWHPANGRACPPSQFIPVAEDLGLIIEIGDWVLRTAGGDLSALGAGLDGVRVAVNVSPRQLRVSGFAAGVIRLLDDFGLSPERLELEVTESVLLDDEPETTANLRALCNHGIRLSIDDFGTGYSSLGYLQRYPFSTLKIDRSFVAAAPERSNASRLVETMVTMAHGLGLEVIAEGVEKPEQLAFLQACGCDMAQGFLFDRPQPLGDILTRRGGGGGSGGTRSLHLVGVG